MLPYDVISDINAKKLTYREIVKYKDFMDAVYYFLGIDDVNALSSLIADLLAYFIRDGRYIKLAPYFGSYTVFEKVWELWESLDLRGTYIYRGTSANFISDPLKGGGMVYCVNCSRDSITNWSYFPLPALYYASQNLSPVVLVAEFDPKRCTKVDYYILRGEVNGLVKGRLVSYGGLSFMWEAEVRCYNMPLGQVKYKLFGSDLLDLLDLTADVYPSLVDKEKLKEVLSCC